MRATRPVQSQANRMALTLLEARRACRVELPLTVRFDHDSPKFTVRLEPRTGSDAILRDSLLDAAAFAGLRGETRRAGGLALGDKANDAEPLASS